jgi:hypothetical protein
VGAQDRVVGFAIAVLQLFRVQVRLELYRLWHNQSLYRRTWYRPALILLASIPEGVAAQVAVIRYVANIVLENIRATFYADAEIEAAEKPEEVGAGDGEGAET